MTQPVDAVFGQFAEGAERIVVPMQAGLATLAVKKRVDELQHDEGKTIKVVVGLERV
jgi:hypothetical protein